MGLKLDKVFFYFYLNGAELTSQNIDSYHIMNTRYSLNRSISILLIISIFTDLVYSIIEYGSFNFPEIYIFYVYPLYRKMTDLRSLNNWLFRCSKFWSWQRTNSHQPRIEGFCWSQSTNILKRPNTRVYSTCLQRTTWMSIQCSTLFRKNSNHN